MIDINEMIREHVKQLNNEYSSGHSKYNGYVKDMSKIGLKTITEKEIEESIKPFLYKWGKMGRVLGRSEFHDWRNNLAKQIRSTYAKLEEFRTKDLSAINLSEFEDDIKRCYESFKEAVGPIAAAKVLHLISPNFFPLWDNPIAKAFKQESKVKDTKEKDDDRLSGQDYYRFMQQVQIFVKKHEKIIYALSNQYGRCHLKIVDECFLCAVRRPLYLLLQKE
jgi:Fe-S-cluster formation regulator IscX/YfhJ